MITTRLMTRMKTTAAVRSALLLCVVALLAGSVPVAAQDDIATLREQRDQVRAEKAAVAADLDPLLAADADLEQAVADLQDHVRTQTAKVETARQAVVSAEEAATLAAGRVTEMGSVIDGLRIQLQGQAIDVYVRPDQRQIDTWLDSSDVTEAAHKQALLDEVTSRESDLLDQLLAAEDELAVRSEAALAAVGFVEDERRAETEALASLESALADEKRIRAALQVRIDDVRLEVDQLAAEDDALSGEIQAILVAEEAERQRLAAEAAARKADLERIARENEEARQKALEEEKPVPTVDPDVLPTPLPAPPTTGGLSWPVAGTVTSEYGPRWGRVHEGIDIAAPTGSAVVAAQGGTVIKAEVYGAYGNLVIIDHGEGFTTRYAHLSEVAVSYGDQVGAGGRLGAVGCTGSCTGPHLHFETRINTIPQNPRLYLG